MLVVLKFFILLQPQKTESRVRLVGLGRKVFILKIGGSNPPHGTNKKPAISAGFFVLN